MQVSCSGKKNVLQVWCFHVPMQILSILKYASLDARS